MRTGPERARRCRATPNSTTVTARPQHSHSTATAQSQHRNGPENEDEVAVPLHRAGVGDPWHGADQQRLEQPHRLLDGVPGRVRQPVHVGEERAALRIIAVVGPEPGCRREPALQRREARPGQRGLQRRELDTASDCKHPMTQHTMYIACDRIAISTGSQKTTTTTTKTTTKWGENTVGHITRVGWR